MKENILSEELENQFEKASMAVNTKKYAYAVELLTHIINIRPDAAKARQL